MNIRIADAAVLSTVGLNLFRGSGAVEGATNGPAVVRRFLAANSSNELQILNRCPSNSVDF